MSDPLFDTLLDKYDDYNYYSEANLLKDQVQDNTNNGVDVTVEFPLAEKKDFDFTPIPDDFDAGDNTLIKYHQDTIKNNNVLYEKNQEGINEPTTIYINGIRNPDDPASPIYAVPGYVDGRKIESEQELQKIAKEKNWFNIYPSDPDGASHQLRVNKVKNIINADGQKLNQQDRTVTDRAKDFGLDTVQSMSTGAEKAGTNFNNFIAEVAAAPDNLADFLGQKITDNPDFNYPGLDKETATKNIQAALSWFDENLMPEFARGSTANIERKYTNQVYSSIMEGISEFATGAVPAAKVVGLTKNLQRGPEITARLLGLKKGLLGLVAPSAAVRGMAWGMIADATVIDPDSPEIVAPLIRKFILDLDEDEKSELSDTVLSILEKQDPNSDELKRLKTANEGAVLGALVEGVIASAKVLPWKTLTKGLGILGTAAIATSKKVVDTVKRIEIDDSTLGSTNIPLRLRPEDSKKKTLNNNNLSFLNEKYSDVDISISEKDKGITLSELVVPEGKRNQGIGTQVMQDIINYADSNNKTIALTPDTTFGGSKTRLKEFYKNLGFVDNKGRNKDFSFTETLIRKPISVDDFNINPNKIKAPTENETGILAFHGSAADFDEFKLDKIGTGEGNQVFGYGLYFSDSEDIAKFYTSALRKKEPVLFKGEPIKYISDTAEGDLVSNDIINLNRVRDRIADKGMSLQEAKDSAIDELQQTISNFQKNDENKKVINELNKDINFINNLQDKDFSYNTGKTYKVDIKAFRDNLLDHDKPVSKQNKIIKDIIQKIYLENDLKPLRKTTTGQDVIDELTVKFSKLENNKLIYDNKKVSEILNTAGIKGIKYGSGQLSGIDDSIATNFVIFDDKIIKVLAKYGIVAPVAVSAIKGNKEQQTQDNSI